MIMETKAIETLIGTAPSAAASILVVVLFLKHLKDRDVFLRDLHQEHERSREASRIVIAENTRVLGEHHELSREVSTILKEVSENIKYCQLKRL